jgi:nicotinamide-nucleotide amidase
VKKAYIISTGTELLLGTTMDSNSVYLSEKLRDIGIKVIGKSTVGDSRIHIKNAFELGLKSADIVISSGGLGPTLDDLTKETACETMGVKLEIVEDELRKLEEFFKRRKRAMPKINKKQAMFPQGAIILKNHLGTAPGMCLKTGEKLVALLPGPPREMKRMYLEELEPVLKNEFELEKNKAIMKTIKVLGPGESQVEEMLGDLMEDNRQYSIALLAQEGEVHIKLTVEGQDFNDSQAIMKQITDEIEKRLQHNVIGYDDETLALKIAELMLKQGKTLALAESCTGGLLAKMITDLPGSSQYFWGSATSYSNSAKTAILNVKTETLEEYGAVSEEVAREMAAGILNNSAADFALAVTGIAGPEGGSEEKPVGTVFICLLNGHGQDYQVKKMSFVGDRDAIRALSAKTALDLLRRYLISGGVHK